MNTHQPADGGPVEERRAHDTQDVQIQDSDMINDTTDAQSNLCTHLVAVAQLITFCGHEVAERMLNSLKERTGTEIGPALHLLRGDMPNCILRLEHHCRKLEERARRSNTTVQEYQESNQRLKPEEEHLLKEYEGLVRKVEELEAFANDSQSALQRQQVKFTDLHRKYCLNQEKLRTLNEMNQKLKNQIETARRKEQDPARCFPLINFPRNQQELQRLKDEKRHSDLKIENLTNAVDGYRSRWIESQHRLKHVSAEARDLRQIIQENSDKGEPTDADIMKMFESLCREVQMLVRKWCIRSPSTCDFSGADDWVRAFYNNLKTVDVKGQKLALRAKIFDILVETHANRGLFGVPSAINSTLAQLERTMRKSDKNTSQDITDWRRRTVQYLSVLDDRIKYDEGCEKRIRKLLQPSTEDGEANVQGAIRNLCESMYTFMILLGQSRSTYRMFAPQIGRIVTNGEEDDLIVERVEGESGEVNGARVIQTLCKGLTKIHHKRGDLVVLVKAQVVCSH